VQEEAGTVKSSGEEQEALSLCLCHGWVCGGEIGFRVGCGCRGG